MVCIAVCPHLKAMNFIYWLLCAILLQSAQEAAEKGLSEIEAELERTKRQGAEASDELAAQHALEMQKAALEKQKLAATHQDELTGVQVARRRTWSTTTAGLMP